MLWVQYFDKSLSRRDGRRVPIKLAVKSPSQKALVEAARALGWDVEVIDNRYPRRWWQREACVLVRPKEKLKKSEVIREIAKHLG